MLFNNMTVALEGLLDSQDDLSSKLRNDIMNLVCSVSSVERESERHISEAGTVVAIRCYYYKRWMPLVGPLKVDFGSKARSTTGYNTMCKAGVNLWTKQYATSKKATSKLVQALKLGAIEIKDIAQHEQKIANARAIIQPTTKGFATKEEVEDYLRSIHVEHVPMLEHATELDHDAELKASQDIFDAIEAQDFLDHSTE